MGDQKEPIDVKDVENGPVTEANRECRDIFCCLLFLGAIGGMVYLTIFAYMNGTPNNIFRGIDPSNNQCGLTAGAQNFPYLYFTNPAFAISQRYCVAACPSFDAAGTLSALSCYNHACGTYAATYQQNGTFTFTSTSSSDIIGYESSAVLSRICLPSTAVLSNGFTLAIQSSFSSALTQGSMAGFISDIKNNYQWLLVGFGFCVVICFLFMFLLRCLAGCIVWLSLFGILIVLVGLGLIFLYNSGQYSALNSAASTVGFNFSLSTSQYNVAIGWTLIGVGILFLIVILCCCSRIRLAVAVCKSAGQFVVSVCLIVLVPIFQAILALGFWGACLIVMVYLVSAASFSSDSGSYFTYIGNYGDPALIRLYCFIFGTLWMAAFISAMGTFVISSACCMWYYSHGPGQELDWPIARSYKMIFRYHFGSLAFGSFILALVQFLQLIVELFKKQAEASGASNKCLEYVTACLQCCLACVQRIVQFINKTAYIQIALRGKNFCSAASDGFELVWSNAMRYAVVSGVGEIIMFLGKLMIAASSAGAFYLLITYQTSIKNNYLMPVYSVALIAIISYLVAIFFMAVYSMAMDTLLQCFIVDETNQKGKGGKAPLYAPEELAELIDRD